MSRITAYSALSSAQSDDVVPIVDVHDTSMAATGTMKKITVGNLIATVFPSGDAAGLDVRVSGAKGDGSTDDTTAFGLARDATGTGGTVMVTPGTYILSALALNVAGQKWVIMPGATLKLKNAANGPIFSISASGVTVTGGGVIDGNFANQTPGFHPLIGVGGTTPTDVTFDGVTVQNANGYGIAAGTGAENISGLTIRNCIFANTQYDALVAGSNSITSDITDIAFINNKVYNNNPALVGGGLGISIVGNPGGGHYARRVTATGNRVECYPIGTSEPGYGDWAAGVHFSGVINGTVVGNAFFGCTLPVTIPDSQDVAILGNSIEGYSGYGIEVPASVLSRGITVTGNTIVDTDPRAGAGYHSEYGISVSASSGATRYVVISGNVINQVTTSGFPSIGIGGGSMVTDHITATGNVINKSAGGGGALVAHKVTNLKISDNVIDCGGTNMNVVWLDSGGAGGTFVAKWSVTGNIIANYGTGAGIIYGSGTENMTYVMITGNSFNNGGSGDTIDPASSGVLASPFLNANNIGP